MKAALSVTFSTVHARNSAYFSNICRNKKQGIPYPTIHPTLYAPWEWMDGSVNDAAFHSIPDRAEMQSLAISFA